VATHPLPFLRENILLFWWFTGLWGKEMVQEKLPNLNHPLFSAVFIYTGNTCFFSILAWNYTFCQTNFFIKYVKITKKTPNLYDFA
jgi:hypothetical protein